MEAMISNVLRFLLPSGKYNEIYIQKRIASFPDPCRTVTISGNMPRICLPTILPANPLNFVKCLNFCNFQQLCQVTQSPESMGKKIMLIATPL